MQFNNKQIEEFVNMFFYTRDVMDEREEDYVLSRMAKPAPASGVSPSAIASVLLPKLSWLSEQYEYEPAGSGENGSCEDPDFVEWALVRTYGHAKSYVRPV